MTDKILVLKHASPLLLKTAVVEYLRFYASDQSTTARAKRLDLIALETYLVESFAYQNLFLEEITQSDVKGFRDRLLDREAPRTVIRRLATVRHFFNYWRQKYPELINPAKGVEPPSIMETEPKRISADERRKLYESAKAIPDPERRLFMLLILDFGCKCGLRVHDMITLRVSNIDFEGMKIRGLRRKKNVIQDIQLMPKTIERILAWLAFREKRLYHKVSRWEYIPEHEKDNFPLLVSEKRTKKCGRDPVSCRIGPKTIYGMVHKFGEQNGIPDLHPHRFRHTFVRRMYRVGGIITAAEAAGHRDLKTTMRYAKSGSKKIRAALNKLSDD